MCISCGYKTCSSGWSGTLTFICLLPIRFALKKSVLLPTGVTLALLLWWLSRYSQVSTAVLEKQWKNLSVSLSVFNFLLWTKDTLFYSLTYCFAKKWKKCATCWSTLMDHGNKTRNETHGHISWQCSGAVAKLKRASLSWEEEWKFLKKEKECATYEKCCKPKSYL